MKSYTYDELQIGQSASVTKTVSESDVYAFAGITGDFNPAHIDAVYAEKTFFKERIAHGMLAASFISTVLGMYLPGPGTVFVSNSVSFTAPVRFGDTITATCEVAEKLEKGKVRLKAVVTNQNGDTVITGESVVSAPRSPRA